MFLFFPPFQMEIHVEIFILRVEVKMPKLITIQQFRKLFLKRQKIDSEDRIRLYEHLFWLFFW